MASEKVTKVLEEISSWTLLEVKDFISAFEEKFDVKAQAAVAVAAGPAAGGAAPAAAAKTEFDVELTNAGANKLNVIKVVRELTALGLAEAKKLVESVPCKVKEGLPEADAKDMIKKLTDAGAQAAMK